MDFYLFFFLFVFHKEFLVISHNFNDQVYTIIIAQPNLDNQIGAIERVDINPQPLSFNLPSEMKFIVIDIVSVKHNLPSKMKFIVVGWNSTVAAMYN